MNMNKVIGGMIGMLTVAALSAVLVSLSSKQASAETPIYTPTPDTPGFILEPDMPGLVLEPDIPIDIPFPTPTPVVTTPVLTTVTFTLYVRETNTSGALIAGANVKGWDAVGASFNQTTNSSGYTTITGIAGTWHLEISKAGYQPAYGLQSIITSHANTICIIPVISVPTAPPAPVTLYLYVHDTNDAGPHVVGASVTGTDANGSPFNQMTNSNGYATIVGAPGTWHITISKTGYQTASSSLNITSIISKTAYIIPAVSAPTTVTLTLYVRGGSAGGPILAGATVTGYTVDASFSKTTNSLGYVTITGVPGLWQISIIKTGYVTNTWHQNISTTSTGTLFLVAEPAPTPPIPPVPTTLSWKILFLVYPSTDFSFMDGSISRRIVGSMTQANIDLIVNRARRFAENDVPILNSGYMVPTVTVRVVQRTLTQLTAESGYWPRNSNTAPELDPTFDSVIVIWQAHGTDVNHNTVYDLNQTAGLCLPCGTKQTYLAIPISCISSNSTNVFKHEWGHCILFYFDAALLTPKPAVDNHINNTDKRYVHCPTGESYILGPADETETNPIPNSVYNNSRGFTHDYYSGTTAVPSKPTTPLGINASAWRSRKPVT